LVAILGTTIAAGAFLPIQEKRIKYVQAIAGQSIKAIDPQTVLAKIWEG
jgi:hypothetical protein